MTAKTFGYVRVSTSRQVHDRQDDVLTEAGVHPDDIYRDKISGAKFDRAGLIKLIGTVVEYKEGDKTKRKYSGGVARPGDTIVVSSLDRLGRSLSEVVQLADGLTNTGIVLKSIKESIDYSSSIGRMLAGIFASLAEYERDLINERAADARAAARARGKQTGRPSKLTDDQARQLRALHAGGESVVDLAKSYGISRPTVYRILEQGTVSA